ncbi:MAG: VWA domain-containing protein [Acidobacteria bacterium]|nr:VWA domain-containing protein [Acidobacteriota bacterium]
MFKPVCCFMLAAFSSTFAQTNTRQQATDARSYTLHTTVQTVPLDVVVTDVSGRTVKNLKQEDFLILEDGKPQTIRSFHPPMEQTSLPMQLHSTNEVDKQAPDAPVSILVIDEISTPFEDGAYARYSLKKYLDAQETPLSQPTMLVVANKDRLVVLQDYTNDKQELLKALDHHMTFYPWGPTQDNRLIFAAPFASLIQLTQATIGHRGHKNILWIGQGFRGIQAVSPNGNERRHNEAVIAACINMMMEARMTLYVIDPGGLKQDNGTAMPDAGVWGDAAFGGEGFASDVSLATVAAETGGRVFFNRNDVNNLIGTSVRSGREFYTLAYNPVVDSTNPRYFHKIEVVMKDPNLKATARHGYFEDQIVDSYVRQSHNRHRDNQIIFDLSAAAMNRMVYDGIPLTVERGSKTSDDFYLHVPAGVIPWQNGEADFNIVVATFDLKGKMIDRASLTTPVHTTSATAPLKLHMQVKTAEPAARIRFVIRSVANGRIGAENFYLIDPKLLSDPVTGLQQTRAEKKQNTSGH